MGPGSSFSILRANFQSYNPRSETRERGTIGDKMAEADGTRVRENTCRHFDVAVVVRHEDSQVLSNFKNLSRIILTEATGGDSRTEVNLQARSYSSEELSCAREKEYDDSRSSVSRATFFLS